jgi:hypothetical protein
MTHMVMRHFAASDLQNRQISTDMTRVSFEIRQLCLYFG